MQDWIEQFAETAVQALYGEGEKVLRIKAVSAAVRVIQGIRGTLFLHYIIQVFCFLCAFGFFFGAYLSVQSFSSPEGFHLSLPMGFCWGVFVISLGVLWSSLREKRWIQAFRIEEMVEKTVGTEESSSVSEHDIERMVERAVARRLNQQNKKTSSD